MAIEKTISERVWIGHDNAIKLTLTNDGVAADISGTTRATLEFGGVTLDSAVDTGAFDWSSGGGLLIMTLGTHVTEPYNGFSVLTIYSGANPNGLVWIGNAGNCRLELHIIE